MEILVFFGGYWAFFRPDLGGKLGDGYQLQIYINQAFLRPWEEIQSRFMLNIFQAKAILCRKDVEERTFAGHFWELRSSNLGAVSFDGFMRSGITRPDQCCNPLALS